MRKQLRRVRHPAALLAAVAVLGGSLYAGSAAAEERADVASVQRLGRTIAAVDEIHVVDMQTS